MEPKKPRERPEAKIQAEIKARLESLGWFVRETHGNAYQSGFPDLYATHPRFGQRWIEVKNSVQYHFTPAQIKCFTTWSGHGIKIWVLSSAEDSELKKLFAPANWHEYLPVNKVITRTRK